MGDYVIAHEISIHAPAKGATPPSPTMLVLDLFQSTLPRRERRVSKHLYGISFSFQSTLPRRERRCRIQRPDIDRIFQSTLPRRERPDAVRVLPCRYDFNPRSREGSDCFNIAHGSVSEQFQSTLPRRERL